MSASATSRAKMAWGDPLPDWITALAKACDASSLRRTAANLNISPALVSLALRNAHHARLNFIENRVREALAVDMFSCPVLGAISVADCRAEQAQPFTSVNPLRVALYRACHGGCEHGHTKENNNDC